MKLTKGKIRKLYNKKNQSLKKYKNKKASYGRKSFRNKKYVNLARKTLKRFAYKKPIGGATEDKPKDKSKGIFNFLPKIGRKDKQIEQPDAKKSTTLENKEEVVKPIENSSTQVIEDINKPVADIVTSAEEPVITTMEEPVVTSVKEEPVVTSVTEEPVVTSVTEEPVVTTAEEPVITSVTEEPVVTTVEEPIVTTVEEPIVTTVEEPIVTTVEEPIVTTVEEPIVTTVEEPAVSSVTEEPIAKEDTTQTIKSTSTETVKNIPSSEVVNSLSTVTNYFADVIADKVTQNISSINNGDKLQDGFNSVNKAVETMAASGGKKNKKTKRFRLTHNKTRQHR
jgi:hypothetical protein